MIKLRKRGSLAAALFGDEKIALTSLVIAQIEREQLVPILCVHVHVYGALAALTR